MEVGTGYFGLKFSVWKDVPSSPVAPDRVVGSQSQLPGGAEWASHRAVGRSQERERGARYTWSRYEAPTLAKYLQPFDSIILVLGSFPKHIQFCKGTCMQW